MPIAEHLRAPLRFAPVYKERVWGGRRMAAWRDELPEGPIGESWDLSDVEGSRTPVADGPLAGRGLDELRAAAGSDLVGAGYAEAGFPLLIKLIDAGDRLSVQVHPDDALARAFGAGERGKTEAWLVVADGGELFHGVREGVDRDAFERALAAGAVAEHLNRFVVRDGDCFFIPARTVHALGAGCLLYEVQQSCDVTFRVYDWGRVGLDGRPRPLHVAESLRTIDFAAAPSGPQEAPARPHPAGGTVRALVACPYFEMAERRAATTGGGDGERCSVVSCLDGTGILAAGEGEARLAPMRTVLVPAAAGPWRAAADDGELRLLVSRPVF